MLDKFAFLGLASAALFASMPAQAQAEFTGAGEESELDCNGGGVDHWPGDQVQQ